MKNSLRAVRKLGIQSRSCYLGDYNSVLRFNA
jgi:hypothetical protein